jgi:dipeptidyl aminopeptidase/acylaminoacyl peptidase
MRMRSGFSCRGKPLLQGVQVALRAAAAGCALLTGLVSIAQPSPSAAPPFPPPAAIDSLREATASATPPRFVRHLEDGPGFKAALVGYRVGGRQLHALVATPQRPAPAAGYPVLMALHGYHPNPPRYGVGQDGLDRRPGDYYRSVPGAYAQAGFMVVMPDYRGHSNSEGIEFTSHPLAAAYYAEDVSGLMHGLAALPQADSRSVFVWGHSMGGEVALRAVLAWPQVRAASLWSTASGDAWEQAHHYDRKASPLAADDLSRPKPGLDKLRRALVAFGPADRNEAREPLRHLDRLKTPLILHHALGDLSTDHRWSARLARELYLRGLPYEFHTYSGADHFFEEPQRSDAVRRDIAFFEARLGRRQ